MQYCPICCISVQPSERYPHCLCEECAARAVDVTGRALAFFNLSFSGGYGAQFADTKEAYDSHICYIDGVKCYADEAHFGGIVIQPVEKLKGQPGWENKLK